jgi:hypothetical protein
MKRACGGHEEGAKDEEAAVQSYGKLASVTGHHSASDEGTDERSQFRTSHYQLLLGLCACDPKDGRH